MNRKEEQNLSQMKRDETKFEDKMIEFLFFSLFRFKINSNIETVGRGGEGAGFARINTTGEEKWRIERWGIEIGKKAGDAAQCSARVRK